MKCEYCEATDHLQTVCPLKAADRRLELGLGLLFFIPMLPFYAIGWLAGMCVSAFKAGFEFTDGIWPQTWNAIRGKKNDESDSV